MPFFRNPYLLWTTIAFLLIAGTASLSGLPRLEDPRLTNRSPLVIARFPGASVERIESGVVEKLEEKLQEVPEIKKIETTIRAGVATLSIELVDSVTAADNEEVFSKIRDKLDQAELPSGALPPVVDDQRGAVAFTLIASLVWDHRSPPRLGILKRHAEELADRLRSLPETEIVRLYGDPSEEIQVTADPEKLAALGLTAGQLSDAIRSADAKVPAGQLRTDRVDVGLELRGELDSIARIRGIPILDSPSGAVTRIADVAEVTRTWREPTETVGLSDGKRTVYVAARMKDGVRVDRWAAEANEIIRGYRSELGSGVSLDLFFDQSGYTEERLGSLGWNLIAGAVVIVLVILVIMGWRSSLLVGSALPLVAAATLFAVFMTGGSLHQMSIFGMILALGLLIDNAIVVVDEIRQHRRAGASRENAVRSAVSHLFIPLLASTLTTVFAFAPIVLLPGNIGDFVGSIGGSVILAILCSFGIALTLIAALAGRFDAKMTDCPPSLLRDGFHSQRLANRYLAGLRGLLNRPVLAIAIATSPALLGFGLASTMGNQFFPRVDRNMFQVEVWLPPESSITNTTATARRIEDQLRALTPAVRHVNWLVGGSAPSVYYNLVMNQDGSPGYAHAIVTTESSESVKASIDRLQRELDRSVPSAQIVVSQFGQGPPISAPVQIRLYGPSIPKLQELGERVRLVMQEHPQVRHTQVTLPRGKPKLWVNVDETASRRAGLSLADVSAQMRAGLDGQLGGTLLEGIEEMPVRVRVSNERRGDLSQVRATGLTSPATNRRIPLQSLGGVTLEPELGGIGRRDGFRCNTIMGYIVNDGLPIQITNDILRELDQFERDLPTGYRLEVGGDAEEESGAVGNLTMWLPVLLTLTVATLVLAFRSIALCLLLGTVAGLSVGLGLLSTWAFGFPISFNTILGTLGLIGVALNDNIVVLSAIRSRPDARAGDITAIAEEISGCTRHIISTTLTTVGGFLPLILGGGDFWPPLAVVIAGGVLGATLIALVYIPASYVLLLRIQRAIFGARSVTREHEPVPEPIAV